MKHSTGFPCLVIEFVQAKEEIRRFHACMLPSSDHACIIDQIGESVPAAESVYVEQSR